MRRPFRSDPRAQGACRAVSNSGDLSRRRTERDNHSRRRGFEKPLLRSVERTRVGSRRRLNPESSRLSLKRWSACDGERDMGRFGGSELIPPFGRAQRRGGRLVRRRAAAVAGRPPRLRLPPPIGATGGSRTCLRLPLATSGGDRVEGRGDTRAAEPELQPHGRSGCGRNVDRWRRGDTGAMLRRLYTEAGQQASTSFGDAFAPTPSSVKRRCAICRSSSA